MYFFDFIIRFGIGWGGRIRTCVWRHQKPLPYHLATPQQIQKQATSPERDGGNIEISLRTCNGGFCAFLSWLEVGNFSHYNGCHSLYGGVWRSLVAHLLREQGVVSSNLATPTNYNNDLAGLHESVLCVWVPYGYQKSIFDHL